MNINEEKYMPIGLVEVEDIESGEIVYTTHNMIVESGRDMILRTLFPTIDRENWPYGSLVKFYEKNHRNLTVPKMTIKQAETSETVDPSLFCRKDDIILNDASHNLSEIVLSTKTYSIGTKTDRKLYLRQAGEDDVEITGGVWDPNKENMTYGNNLNQFPLGDTDSLVIKFTDGYDSGTANDPLYNQVIHICCADENSVSSKAITAVGLAFENNGVLTLFSRAAIDPIFMRPGRHYVMHYTMHF